MTPRNALGALCASALLALTACSSGGSGEPGAGPSSSGSAGPGPVISPERVQAVSTDAVSRAGDAVRARGSDARAARTKAFTGPALRATKADAKLAHVSPTLAPDNPALSSQQPTPLAVSQGSPPGLLVLQSGAGQGALPRLQLVRSDAAGKSWKVAEAATMLPGTEVAPFAALADGSPTPPADQRSGLSVAPDTLLQQYAASLAYPRKPVNDPPFTGDHFGNRVRESARSQAQETEAYATFRQEHQVLPDDTHVVKQQDGSALVFAVLERTDTFTVADGRTLNAPKSFTAFEPKQDKINDRAQMTTLEFVVLQVPRGTGRASVIAASEHLVGARGH
ncbi:MAG TPA: hypothetical protein VFJ12_04595 [Segeticoccus sp.]|nr:hypothetical protein [Segeticoccus sp.]